MASHYLTRCGRFFVTRPFDPQRIYAITRPEPVLLTYYLISALAGLFLYPLVLIPLMIRYYTLGYRFDKESIRKTHGLIFRHEDLVQYARIQDLHISRGILQRWLGLATIEIQTAAGSMAPEMTIIGLTNFEELRDFLYSKMRGARFGEDETVPTVESIQTAESVGKVPPSAGDDAVLTCLTEIRDEIRLLRGRRS